MKIAAGVIAIFLGLGFGLPAIGGIRHLRSTGEVWTFMGFPTYGGGPFERMGIPTSVPLLAAFVAICLAEVVVGVMLIIGAPYARALGFALLPLELLFWIGFALPFGPPLGIARAVLLALA
jgi:hypothetical protein